MLGILGKLKSYAFIAISAVGAVLLALVFGLFRGRKDGAASAIAASAQSSIKAVEARNTIEAQIAKQPEGESAKILKGKWSRD